MFENVGAAIAVGISALALLGSAVGWLLADAREKTRATLLGEQVRELRSDNKQRAADVTRLQAEHDHLRAEIARLESAKADRAVLQAVNESLARIDRHLEKLDEKIDGLRPAALQ